TKKVSAYGVDNEIVEEIQKFPYPFQKLLIKEACAVMKRIESGKNAPGLTSLDCDCLFTNKYLLPCKHIFHEHMYGSTKLLTNDVWKKMDLKFMNGVSKSPYLCCKQTNREELIAKDLLLMN